ncbi:MAG: AAA family ATPase [Bacteroidota bacterium]
MQQGEERSAEILPYKARELKVYNSTEFLWDNVKKYRQVFDQRKTTYVYAELSLFNKQFDREDWSLRVEFRCFQIKGQKRTEVCHLTIDKEVSKFEPTVFLREGWGNQKPGTFWKRGTYSWEAYIDGQRVASKSFYVIEPTVQPDDEFTEPLDKFIELQSVRMYEGPYDDVSRDDRNYLRAFSRKESRYIYLELLFKNLQPHQKWHLELATRFHNQARELKGQVVRLLEVPMGHDLIHITAGWGAATPTLWREDGYVASVVFMDQLMVTVPFDVGEENIEGHPAVLLPGRDQPQILAPEAEDEESFDQIMSRLDALIGLKEIKKQVREHAVYLQFLQLRRDKGFAEAEPINVHAVFRGNPGTGKTTVATMMGRLYKKMGLLSSGHVVTADRVDLVGEYIGQTAPKTREVIDRARGGVLFIDEAYALARANDDGKDFGREVIEILVKEMSNGEGDLAVIVAGYPDEMDRFLDSNPGLKSRFKHHYKFPDFLPQELSIIAQYACERQEVTLSTTAQERLGDMIVRAYRERDRTFGNARFVHDLIEKAKMQLGLRIMQLRNKHELDPSKLRTVELEDIEKLAIEGGIELPAIPIDEKLLTETLEELDALIGMEKVKTQLKEMVNLVRYYRRTGRDVLNAFNLHTVLIGNPGTGKTTIARILAKLYKALGILERGHLVETDRQGLVAGYVGQTATKTSKQIDKAKGGVLFIDEAYSLTAANRGPRGDFGEEAIQTLLKRMEDLRGQFFVFVAGYPDNMDHFLRVNPGLNSRFDKYLEFDDYSGEELLKIAEAMLATAEAKLTSGARAHLIRYFNFLHKYRDKYFGNARAVRQIVQDILRRHDLRKSDAKTTASSKKQESIKITKADVEHLLLDTKTLSIQRKQIGF